MPERAALLVTGTVGAGKTTTAEVVGDLLREATVPNAVVDLDRLSATWPAPPEDRFNLGVQLRNLRDVSRNYLDAGVRRLVLAGVVETPEDRGRHAAATGLPLTVVRLRLDPAVLRARLVVRHEGDADGLAWHLSRAEELDGVLDRCGAADATVDTTGLSRVEAARAVLVAAGWTEEALGG